MDSMDCETCGLRWGPAGSHPPCLDLPKEERRELLAEALKHPVNRRD